MKPAAPFSLRPHHLLCLAAFCGDGYSEAFIRRMAELQADYLTDRPFRLTRGPDPICGMCPNRQGTQCGASEGVSSRELDERVMQGLKLDSQEVWTWQEVAARLRELPRSRRDALCTGCSWFEKSHCSLCIARRLGADALP